MNRYYDSEFKKNVVELLCSSGKSIKLITRVLACSTSALGEWKRDHEYDNSTLAQDSN